jgi:hypothetical protein
MTIDQITQQVKAIQNLGRDLMVTLNSGFNHPELITIETKFAWYPIRECKHIQMTSVDFGKWFWLKKYVATTKYYNIKLLGGFGYAIILTDIEIYENAILNKLTN